MVTIIKKKTKKGTIKEILLSIKNKEKFLQVSKYSGKLKLKQNPLTIQKKLRNEWS